MTIEEVILTRQIEMNNGWHLVSEVETEALTLFKNKLGDGQVLLPVKINKANAFESFSKDKHLAKIFSSVLDVYDQLPFHPDLAFDSAWRVLEYELKLYAQKAWGAKPELKLDELFSRFSTEVFASLINSDNHLRNAFDTLVNNISLPALKYMTLRLFFRKDLSVAPQVAFVKRRADSILGDEMLSALYNAYAKEDGNLDTMGVQNVARRFERILKGQDMTVGEKTFKPISLESRIELLISVMLYTSRCERFHGDIYSPFKSSKSKLSTYYEYYFLTLSCLFFFWAQMYKLIEREESLKQFVIFENIESAVFETINQMNSVLSKD